MVSREGKNKMSNIIDQLEQAFAESQKKDEKKPEKKSYSDMTDAEKLKVKTAQLKKEKAKVKELQEKLEFYQKYIISLTKQQPAQKTSEKVPPRG